MLLQGKAAGILLLGRRLLVHYMTSTTPAPPAFQHNNNRLVVVLAGPTAVGKSDVAAELCDRLPGGMVVSADSVQAYRGVQIGANKPTAAARQRTPHLLVDVADHTENYNAAHWREDALYAIRRLLLLRSDEDESIVEEAGGASESARQRHIEIVACIQAAKEREQYSDQQPLFPVVVGGTMMYLHWLVHGRPDAVEPTPDALAAAKEQIDWFESNKDWPGAVVHVESMGEAFAQQATKLSCKDWYRLRRILEVACTVQEKNDERLAEQVYRGVRTDSLSSFGYDVRCFFLCPNDRMKHAKAIDHRCEIMVRDGLMQETTGLAISGELPEMASKAIGYRQTLDYIGRPNPVMDDIESFQEYLDHFTGATRRYAKRQMQWFRRDDNFVFIPVDLDKSKGERMQCAVDEIYRMLGLSREDFDRERTSKTGMSAQTRQRNEQQGKGMRTFMSERQIFKNEAAQTRIVLQEADACTNSFQAKRSSCSTQEG